MQARKLLSIALGLSALLIYTAPSTQAQRGSSSRGSAVQSGGGGRGSTGQSGGSSRGSVGSSGGSSSRPAPSVRPSAPPSSPPRPSTPPPSTGSRGSSGGSSITPRTSGGSSGSYDRGSGSSGGGSGSSGRNYGAPSSGSGYDVGSSARTRGEAVGRSNGSTTPTDSGRSSGSTTYREGPSGRSAGSTGSGSDSVGGAPAGSAWRARDSRTTTTRGGAATGIPDGDYSRPEAPPVRFPRLSDSRERTNTVPGEGPTPGTELRRSTSPDLEVRRGQGQTEWRSRTVTRDEILRRYLPSDGPQRGETSKGAPNGRGTDTQRGKDTERLTDGQRGAPRTSTSRGRDEGQKGAPSDRRTRTDSVRTRPDGDKTAYGKPDALDRSRRERPGDDSRARGIPDQRTGRDDGQRGRPDEGSRLVRDRKARTRDEYRDLPPVERTRVINDLPGKDLGKATSVRNASVALSRTTDLGVRMAAATVIGFTTHSRHGWSFWFGYNGGYDPYCWDSCANWWWGPGCNYWWYWSTPCYGWGWTFGWSYCWRSCWNSCGNYYWWYPPYYRSYAYYAPPPTYYSPVVYETIVYREDDRAVAANEVAPAEDVGESSEPRITIDQSAIPLETRQELNRAADYYLTLGDRAFREARYGDAVHFYAKAVEFSSEDGILYLILSDALFATGDYHYAAFCLRKALELDSTLAKSVVDKHSFYGDPLDFDRQLAVLERYLEDHFEDDDARLVLGANYLFGGRPAAAVDLLESPFSKSLLGSPAGGVLLEAARAIQYGRPESGATGD